MQPTMTFLSWGTAFLFIGLILLMSRKYILKNAPDRTAVLETTRRLLILAVLVMATGVLFFVPIFILR